MTREDCETHAAKVSLPGGGCPDSRGREISPQANTSRCLGLGKWAPAIINSKANKAAASNTVKSRHSIVAAFLAEIVRFQAFEMPAPSRFQLSRIQ